DQFKEGIVLVGEPQKTQMLKAHAAQIAAAEAAMAAAAGAKWKPLVPLSEKSPTDLRTTIAAESIRLSALPLAEMRNCIILTEAAAQDLTAKDPIGAESNLKQAQILWPQYEVITRITPALAALKLELAATPTPSP